MTHSLCTAVVDLLSADIPEPWVRERAKALNVVRRVDKVYPYALVMVALLGLVVRGPTTLAQLGQIYCRVSSISLARSASWARMSPGLAAAGGRMLDASQRLLLAFFVPSVTSLP